MCHLLTALPDYSRLQIVFTPEEYAWLKEYSKTTSRSMSELGKDFILLQMHEQACCCTVAEELLKANGQELDPRINKSCWGFKCSYCKHAKACMAGESELTFVPTDLCIQFTQEHLKEHHRSLDGTEDEYKRSIIPPS